MVKRDASARLTRCQLTPCASLSEHYWRKARCCLMTRIVLASDRSRAVSIGKEGANGRDTVSRSCPFKHIWVGVVDIDDGRRKDAYHEQRTPNVRHPASPTPPTPTCSWGLFNAPCKRPPVCKWITTRGKWWVVTRGKCWIVHLRRGSLCPAAVRFETL